MIDDPYHDKKIYHKAHLISADGDVSPLCAGKPKALDLSKELWTTTNSAVTCPKCLRLLCRELSKQPVKTNKYKCKHCGYIRTVRSGKVWIKSYCEKSDKTVHLMKINKG